MAQEVKSPKVKKPCMLDIESTYDITFLYPHLESEFYSACTTLQYMLSIDIMASVFALITLMKEKDLFNMMTNNSSDYGVKRRDVFGGMFSGFVDVTGAYMTALTETSSFVHFEKERFIAIYREKVLKLYTNTSAGYDYYGALKLHTARSCLSTKGKEQLGEKIVSNIDLSGLSLDEQYQSSKIRVVNYFMICLAEVFVDMGYAKVRKVPKKKEK